MVRWMRLRMDRFAQFSIEICDGYRSASSQRMCSVNARYDGSQMQLSISVMTAKSRPIVQYGRATEVSKDNFQLDHVTYP